MAISTALGAVGTALNAGFNLAQNAAKNRGVLGSGSRFSMSSAMNYLKSITDYNNAWSAQQADKAMAFNRDEAEKNRKWQEYMSNTAHQREVQDLMKAGLNPILSVTGGAGAPVTSGATATGYMGETDRSLSSGLVSLFGNLLAAQTSLANKALDAQTNLAVADKYNETSKAVAQLQAQTQLTTNRISALASMYNARTGASATVTAAGIHAAAQKYGYDISSMTQKEIAGFNAIVNKHLQDDKQAHEFDIKEAYPSNLFGAGSSLLGQITGDEGMSGVVSAAKSLAKDLLGKKWTGGRR